MKWKSDKNGKILFLTLFAFLTLATLGGANAQNSTSSKWNGLKLPTVYQNKLDDFLTNNNVMKDEWTRTFTTNFVEKEMETDRWISKENQLLFIRHAIYKQVTDQDLYDWQDGNQKIAEDFNNRGVNIRIRACWQKYRNWALAYMNQRSAEARQQSAEARQQSAEARQQSINALNKALDGVIDFYNSYQISPDPTRLESFKPKVKELISRCKDLWIDYKAKLSPEMLKFYGVE